MSERPTGKRPKNCTEDPKSPYWQYDFCINGERERGTTGKTTAREAAAVVEERKALMRRRQASQLEGTTRRIKDAITITEACALYETKVSNPTCDPTTAYQLANLLAILCEDDEQRQARDVTTGDMERYRLRRPLLSARPISVSTINREVELARRVWRYATRLGYDVGDQILWSDVIDKDGEVARVRELTVAEERLLFAALAKRNPDLRHVAEFAVLCGQRRKAVFQLRWADIDWSTREATVQLKTRGERKRPHTFPLTQRMVEIIKSCPKEGPFIFTYECRRDAPRRADRPARVKGHRFPFSLQGWTRQWRAALVEAGITDFRWHDLRHTAATRLLRRTNNIKAAQKLLAHATIDQTARYAHVFNEDLRAMMEQSEALHAERRSGSEMTFETAVSA